jgi:hypothetical protein
MQFTDSVDNIAAGALIWTNTLFLYFHNIFSVFREILKGKGLFHVTVTWKHVTSFERVPCPPFVLALKGIKFLSEVCKRGLGTA